MHPLTLALACLALELCCAAGLYLMSHAGTGLHGLRWFTWSYVCAAIAITPGLFHSLPEPPAISNLVRFFLLVSVVLLTQGAAEIVCEKAQTLAWGAGMTVAVLAVELMIAAQGAAAGGKLAAIALFGLAYAAQMAVTVLLLWTNRAEGERAASRATALILGALAALGILRAVLTRRGWVQPQILIGSPLRSVVMGAYLMLMMGMAFGFLWMAIARQRQKLARQASTDALTGVLNRRALDTAADCLAADCRAHGAAVAVLAIDLDRFKLLNDTFGHAGGDAVLTSVAQLLTANLRPTDVVARFGGEEFVALLPERNAPTAQAIAERLRRRVADMTVEFEGSRLAVTASIGVAHSDGSESRQAEWRELLRRADRLLYDAKQAGRNCIRSESFAPYSNSAAAPA